MDKSLSDAENIKILVKELGLPEAEARFALAIEKGEVKSDIVLVDSPTKRNT